MPEMKDSGVDWIGYIPRHWSKTKIKYISSLKTGGTPKDKIGIDLQGDYMWITPSDINGSYIIDRSTQYISKKAIKENKYRLFPPRSILLVCIASVGKVGITNEYSYSNQQITAVKPNNKIIPKYLLYSMVTSEEIIKHDASNNVVPIINSKYLDNFSIPFPSTKEQKMISDYLDSKCSEIDALRAEIEDQIRLLEEYKKSVVYDTISFGTRNSVLKKTDSDVWPYIPEGWNLIDIKYLFEIVKRIAHKEGYDILSVTQRGLKVKDISNNEGQIAENYGNYQFVYPTDYVMNHMDLLTGWVDCSTMFGVTSPDYRVFRLIDKEHNSLDFFKYVMQCCYMCRIFYSLGQGVSNLGRWRLQTSAFYNFKIPFPPYQEQMEIASFLNTKCSEIDSLVSKKKQQLSLLEDYKKSLIYEYVTGKKEVPADFTGGES